MWFARNFPFLFLAAGVVTLLAALVAGYSVWSFHESAAQANGTVIGNRQETAGDGGYTYHPEVRFSSSDGRVHTFVSSTGTNPPAFRAGESVPVLYDEKSPDQAGIGTFFQQWFVSLLPAGLGLIFAIIGVVPLHLRARRARMNEWLRLNGQPVEADFEGVHLNTGYEVNGANPYRIVARWRNPATGEMHVFRSENLWYDPARFVPGGKIRVLLDPANPKRYWLDTSFLPKLAP